MSLLPSKLTDTRTKKATLSSLVSTGAAIAKYPLTYILRPILIMTIGVNALGMFNVVTSFAFAFSIFEIAISSSMNAALYHPLSTQNWGKVRGFLKLYRKLYYFVGAAVIFCSLCTLPFIPGLTAQYEDTSDFWQLLIPYIIFFMVLIGSVSYYFFFLGKRLILNADQRQYIATGYSGVINLVSTVVQIVAVLITKNVIVYAAVVVLFQLLTNVILFKKSQKMFGVVDEYEPIEPEQSEIKTIKMNAVGSFMSFAQYILGNALFPIYLSLYGGLSLVVQYTSYHMIYETLSGLINNALNSIITGIGNAKTNWGNIKAHQTFMNFGFLAFLISSITSVCIFNGLRPFIGFWLGDNMLFQSDLIALLLSISLFVLVNFGTVFGVFDGAYGLMSMMIPSRIVGIVLNIFFSMLFIFILNLGPIGVPLSIIATSVLSYFPWALKITFREVFKVGKTSYIISLCYHIMQFAVILSTSYLISSLIRVDNNLAQFGLNIAISVIISAVILFLCNFKRSSFKWAVRTVRDMIRK